MVTLEAMCLVADDMTQPDNLDLPSTRSSEHLLKIPSNLFSASERQQGVVSGHAMDSRKVVPTVFGYRDRVRTN